MLMGAQTTMTAARRGGVEEKAWALVQRVGIFGYAEIAAELSISIDAATKIVRGWQAEGRVKVRHGGSGRVRKMFELTPAYREPQDRGSLIAAQLWTGMRGLKTFCPEGLRAHCREDLKVTLEDASAYCQALLRGGYLRVESTAVPGKREARYKLVHNSGPRAPVEKRVKAVWDPNEGAYAFVSGVGRVERAK